VLRLEGSVGDSCGGGGNCPGGVCWWWCHGCVAVVGMIVGIRRSWMGGCRSLEE
jgi:hypothetical protein